MTIFYTSPEHKARWLRAILSTGKMDAGQLDPEYGAALYILTSSAGTWNKAQSYVDRDGIDFEALLAEVDFSGAYSQLIRLAGNLFNGQTACSPVELMRLDDRNFTLAMNALQIRRVSLPLDELASKAERYNIEMDIRNRISAENRDARLAQGQQPRLSRPFDVYLKTLNALNQSGQLPGNEEQI